MAKTVKAAEYAPPARALKLWIGILLPPISTAVQLQTLWLTSEYGCLTSNFLWNHLVSAAAVVISASGGFVAYQEFQHWGGHGERESAEPDARRRFMAAVGILTGLLFTTFAFAMWLPTLLGVPCAK
jgi:hypothetical protein